MVKIRLARVGSKNKPKYRIVATDARKPRNGSFLEILGSYDPGRQTNKLVLSKERYEYWCGVGAQVSQAALKLVGGL